MIQQISILCLYPSILSNDKKKHININILVFSEPKVLSKLKLFSRVCMFPGKTKEMIKVLHLTKSGDCQHECLTNDQFLASIREYKLPFRDLRMILKASESSSKATHPVLMPRPSSKCFIFEMEHIKLLCFSDKCIILNTEDKAAQIYVAGLKDQFKSSEKEYIKLIGDSQMRKDDVTNLDFEHIVLEYALENVVQKFKRHLQIIKPSLEMLLQQIELNPETNGLRRLLAVKKSLTEFALKVEHVKKVIRNILAKDEDMINLYLTKSDRKVGEHEEIELLLSSYSADLEEIETEIKIFIDMIEDTDQFISAHLDSVRNEIIKMSLYIEIGALAMGFGAVISGIFGMNLKNPLEENAYAFNTVILIIVLTMIVFFVGFTKKILQTDG